MIPEGYRNILGSIENTEKAIKAVKDMFQENLSAQLALLRVTAPMAVLSGMGLNDDLNGVEKPVSFKVKDMEGRDAEIVHSLAKWKRMKLSQRKPILPHSSCRAAAVATGLFGSILCVCPLRICARSMTI